jgi:hypothetical protein
MITNETYPLSITRDQESIMSNKFSRIVEEKLGWYVYALIDPRNNRLFYIGKGKDSRVFAHAADAIDGDAETEKLALIREIHAAGHSVETLILRHAISSEKQAYLAESVLIDFCDLLVNRKMDLQTGLANIVAGHHSEVFGVMSTEDVISLYEAPEAPKLREKGILFRIPQRWTPAMPAEDLYESTHGWWILGPRRSEAKYAFAVSKGVIRAVYRIGTWRERTAGDRGFVEGERKRWGFDGEIAPEMSHFLNTSVAHLFKKGNASPAMYTYNVKGDGQ